MDVVLKKNISINLLGEPMKRETHGVSKEYASLSREQSVNILSYSLNGLVQSVLILCQKPQQDKASRVE